ncbi:MAG: protein kinase, partial [Myxococcales bacterium]|nr:protein kinase [Myxococcales bacterium]
MVTSDDTYQIEKVLGTGAYGTVYAATMRTPAGLERKVALKVVNPEHSTPSEVARLRDEARLLAKVKH